MRDVHVSLVEGNLRANRCNVLPLESAALFFGHRVAVLSEKAPCSPLLVIS